MHNTKETGSLRPGNDDIPGNNPDQINRCKHITNVLLQILFAPIRQFDGASHKETRLLPGGVGTGLYVM